MTSINITKSTPSTITIQSTLEKIEINPTPAISISVSASGSGGTSIIDDVYGDITVENSAQDWRVFQQSIQAGESISALKCVYIDTLGKLRVCQDTNGILNFLGIAKTSGVLDDFIKVATMGVLEDTNWNWSLTNRILYVDSSGSLTQTPPTSMISLQVAKILTPTKIFIHQINPVVL